MNWTVLKSLNEIYNSGRTRKKVSLEKDSTIDHLLDTRELKESGKYLIEGAGFQDYYKKRHLKNFDTYLYFLETNDILKPQLRFQEEDILILIDLKERMDSDQLTEIRDQIVEYEESVRGVSSMFFKNEKYLVGKDSLIKAVKKVLNITILADDKDQQYVYVLACEKPKLIVLCENLDFLKRPSRPRKHNIELWYAGGRNITKLQYSNTKNLPIYYSCDWDFDGLDIYENVQRIFPDIKLLTPNANSKSITETEHKSHWKLRNNPSALSGLTVKIYNEHQLKLIEYLIRTNHWIIEEDNNLIDMIIT